jgi:hypothetical protein
MKQSASTSRSAALVAALFGLLFALCVGASAFQLKASSDYSLRACGTIQCSSDAECEGTFCPFCDTAVSGTCRDHLTDTSR